MKIPADQWATVSSLLDEALDLDPDARPDWLGQLTAREPRIGAVVKRLLATHAERETADVLATLPRLDLAAAPAVPMPSALSMGERVGPYRLLRELGTGGMADVWLAERADGAFTREVALKIPRLSRLRQDLAERFARERDILARLEHPNVARLYDAGVSADGLPYLAMEYVDGEPITAWCDSQRLPVTQRLHLFRQVLDAVQFAHSNLIIHRDLKPSNILVTANGQVQLLDFGIAKLLADDDSAQETQLTRLSGRALTPDYASPEQIKGEPLTIASDVYSLGVVLYELLTGQRPYRLKLQSAVQLEQAILATEPVRPSGALDPDAAALRGGQVRQVARALAGDLDTIVLKSLAKAPGERFATVVELANDLVRHASGRPILARATPWPERLRKFIARNHVPVAAAGTVLAALIAGLSVSLWQAQVARVQAARANEVKDFAVSIFENVDPYRGASIDTKAVDVLRVAQQRLANSALTNPETRIELMLAIGSSLVSLGDYRQAGAVLREAADLAAVHLGELHPHSARIQLQLGSVSLIDDLDAAAPRLELAERAMRHLDDMKGLSLVLTRQSSLHQGRGDHDRAIALAREAVSAAQIHARSGDTEPLIASYSELAGRMLVARRIGMMAPAQQAFDLMQATRDAVPAALQLDVRSKFAAALVREGDAARGVAMLREIAAEQEAVLGPKHATVGASYAEIGRAAYSTGDAHGAIEAARRAKEILRDTAGGAPHQRHAFATNNLGVVLAFARRYEAALQHYAEAQKEFAAIGDTGLAGLRSSRSFAVDALTRLGRIAEAETLLAELLKQPGADATMTAAYKGRLGNIRSSQGRHDEAYALLREAADYFATAKVGIKTERAMRLADLGRALNDGGRAADALAVLQEALVAFRDAHRTGSPDIADALVQLARAHLASGQPQAAKAAASEAAAYWSRVDPASRSAGIAQLWWARALAAVGDAATARTTLREAVSILTSTARPPDAALLAQAQREYRLQTVAQP